MARDFFCLVVIVVMTAIITLLTTLTCLALNPGEIKAAVDEGIALGKATPYECRGKILSALNSELAKHGEYSAKPGHEDAYNRAKLVISGFHSTWSSSYDASKKKGP